MIRWQADLCRFGAHKVDGMAHGAVLALILFCVGVYLLAANGRAALEEGQEYD
jgi:hypothetical protein